MSLVSTAREFKYEVAFSFLERDEQTAYALNDLLQDRFKTFIYSERQKELVGRDGQTAFRKVFVEEARIVVVLYREAWGTTKWTRVEEDAIKERVFEESPDFLVFINIDKGKPAWLSQVHLRLYLEKYGLIQAAAIVESRVEEYGGVVHAETVAEKASRHQRELEFNQWLALHYTSEAGVRQALAEYVSLHEQLTATMSELRANHGYRFTNRHQLNRYVIYECEGVALAFHWTHVYTNSLSGSSLQVQVVDAEEFSQYRSPSYRAKRFAQGQYHFTVNQVREGGWRKAKDEGFIKTDQLIQEWVGTFLDQVHDTRLQRERSRIEL